MGSIPINQLFVLQRGYSFESQRISTAPLKRTALLTVFRQLRTGSLRYGSIGCHSTESLCLIPPGPPSVAFHQDPPKNLLIEISRNANLLISSETPDSYCKSLLTLCCYPGQRICQL